MSNKSGWVILLAATAGFVVPASGQLPAPPLVAPAASPQARPPADPEAEPELPHLVATLGRVAGLYLDAALGFTCQERLIDTRYRGTRILRRETHRFEYFYVFNDQPAVAEGGGTLAGLADYRTLRSDDPYAPPTRVDPRELGVAAYLERAYSWIFIFQPGSAVLTQFTLAGEGRALDRAAWIVEFEPGERYVRAVNDWFGRVWIDQETYQLLRVEAAKSDELVARLSEEDGAAGGRFLFTQAQVEFATERNGLRFPSDATVFGAWVEVEAGGDAAYRAAARKAASRVPTIDRVFRIQQQYRDYRFFSVRTASEVNARIEGIIR